MARATVEGPPRPPGEPGCGAVWERDAARRCGLCGSTDLRYTPKPLWEKGRGDQRTPAGELPGYACWSCGGRDVTSPNPIPGTSA